MTRKSHQVKKIPITHFWRNRFAGNTSSKNGKMDVHSEVLRSRGSKVAYRGEGENVGGREREKPLPKPVL